MLLDPSESISTSKVAAQSGQAATPWSHMRLQEESDPILLDLGYALSLTGRSGARWHVRRCAQLLKRCEPELI